MINIKNERCFCDTPMRQFPFMGISRSSSRVALFTEHDKYLIYVLISSPLFVLMLKNLKTRMHSKNTEAFSPFSLIETNLFGHSVYHSSTVEEKSNIYIVARFSTLWYMRIFFMQRKVHGKI